MLKRVAIDGGRWRWAAGWISLLVASVSCTSVERDGMRSEVGVPRQAGGALLLGDELSLAVAPESLPNDVTLGVTRLATLQRGEVDGYVAFGQGYRFSPSGTVFDLSRPAKLSLRVDVAAARDQGLDLRSLALFYFDDDLNRYVSVGGAFDETAGLLRAEIEHFTIYVPMARALIPGNIGPVVTLQATVPATLRCGSPTLMRALVRDYTQGGSIAGAVLKLRHLVSNQVFSFVMHPDPAALDVFSVLVPASYFPASVMGPASDVEYWVEADDNLGAVTTSAIATVNIVRTIVPGTLTLNPNASNLAAGYQRSFTVSAVDDVGTSFQLVPEAAATVDDAVLAVGAPGLTGILVTAQRVGSASMSASVQLPSDIGGGAVERAVANVVVFNGPLESVSVLSAEGDSIDDLTLVLREGGEYTFDALGTDQGGNAVLVVPQWSLEPQAGYYPGLLSSNGVLNTVDADGFGRIIATVGPIRGTQWVDVRRRTWQFSGALNVSPAEDASITVAGGTPTVAHISNGDLRVSRWDGLAWVPQGGSLNVIPGLAHRAVIASGSGAGATTWVAWNESGPIYARYWNGTDWAPAGAPLPTPNSFEPPALAVIGGVAHVAYVERPVAGVQPARVFVRRWDGSRWQQLGGALNVVVNDEAGLVSIAGRGNTPYVSFIQHTPASFNNVVVRWNGTNWEQLGGAVNFSSVSYEEHQNALVAEPELALAFRDGDGLLRVRTWDGTSWNLRLEVPTTHPHGRFASVAAAHSAAALYVIADDFGPAGNENPRVRMYHIGAFGPQLDSVGAPFIPTAVQLRATLAIGDYTQWTIVDYGPGLYAYRL